MKESLRDILVTRSLLFMHFLGDEYDIELSRLKCYRVLSVDYDIHKSFRKFEEIYSDYESQIKSDNI